MVIKDVISEIKKLLFEGGMYYSREKTLPTTVKDIRDRIRLLKEHHWNDFFVNIEKSLGIDEYNCSDYLSDIIKKDEALGNKLLTLGIKIEPERIDEEGIDNSLTLSRLSASSDINVKTLSDESLELYIQELITYMKVKGDIGELKEETAKIFAAWRLNASYS